MNEETTSIENNNSVPEIKKREVVRPNIFRGKAEEVADGKKYPEWDVVPPEGEF